MSVFVKIYAISRIIKEGKVKSSESCDNILIKYIVLNHHIHSSILISPNKIIKLL